MKDGAGRNMRGDGPGEPLEEVRRRVLAALELGAGATVRWVKAAWEAADRLVRALEAGVDGAAGELWRAAGVDPRTLTVERVVARAPAGVTSAVGAVGEGLARAGRWLEKVLRFLPRDRQWRKAASGMSILLAVVAFSSFAVPPEAKPFPGGRRLTFVGYFENGWGGWYVDSFPTFQRHVEMVDIVMPFWHSVHPDGSVEDRGVRREVIDFARSHGVKVVPLFNNAKVRGSAGFLVSAQGREQAVKEIVEVVRDWGYDGVHIDFELLPPEWREAFTSFIAELRLALGDDSHLSVAVFPKVDISEEIHGLYDYRALAELCDFIVLMGYDRHWATAPAGPVSPYDWIERNLEYALETAGVEPLKLVLGVGGYGYDWPAGGGKANPASVVPSRFAADLARRRGATLKWDDESNNPHFTYFLEGVRHDVWYQDERVMALRLSQARSRGLRGIALWRLGYETPATWKVIARELGPRS